VERRAGDRVGHAMRGWAKNQNPRSPFLSGSTLYDPHARTTRLRPLTNTSPISTDGEVAYADGGLGKLFTYMRQHGLYDRALITMMSDHGGSLGAHGEEYGTASSLRRKPSVYRCFSSYRENCWRGVV